MNGLEVLIPLLFIALIVFFYERRERNKPSAFAPIEMVPKATESNNLKT